MEIVFSKQALADRDYWKNTGNIKIMNKISELLCDIQKHPFMGIGKPEALKYVLSGKWSRRINKEHRIIYCVVNDQIHILSLKYHYSKK